MKWGLTEASGPRTTQAYSLNKPKSKTMEKYAECHAGAVGAAACQNCHQGMKLSSLLRYLPRSGTIRHRTSGGLTASLPLARGSGGRFMGARITWADTSPGELPPCRWPSSHCTWAAGRFWGVPGSWIRCACKMSSQFPGLFHPQICRSWAGRMTALSPPGRT